MRAHSRSPAGTLGLDKGASRTTTSTRTLLFTDLARSTELYERLGDDAAERVRRAHFAGLRDAAGAYEGEVVKTLGDGLMLSFGSCVNALSCAIVMQQLASSDPGAHPGAPLGLRIGLNVGEVVSDEDDFFGVAVVLASRLCGRAAPGQILLSDVMRNLVGSRGGYRFEELGPTLLKGIAEPQRVHEVLWRAAPPPPGGPPAPEGGAPARPNEIPLSRSEVADLQQILRASGLEELSLQHRYSVVFVYPGMGIGDLHHELAGCTTQVCAIIGETDRFHDHGIQVIGLSTEPSTPPDGCSFIPFPVAVLPQDAFGGVIDRVDKGTRSYAARTSFVVFPDGTGVRVRDVRDVIAHVKRSFELAVSHRLSTYRDVTFDHLARHPGGVRSNVEFKELLANGADSVAIARVDVRLELVCKLATSEIIAAEAGYVQRVNSLLRDAGLANLFPAVITVRTDETPSWYLMEAANPVSLDQLVFADEARTLPDPAREPLLTDALGRVAALYDLTFRAEVPKIARYHYLGRFEAIPRREDAARTFSRLVGSEGGLAGIMSRRLVIGDEMVCCSYDEQLRFLRENIDALVQPVGAYVHGDLHLPNMLLDSSGERVVFIDPRVVWDGHDVGDPGFCDPIYDLATLLHSLHTMSAILNAVAGGESERLLGVSAFPAGDGSIEIAPGVLDIAASPVVDWFTTWVEASVSEEVRGANWRPRLHVGAANALVGWLKYADAVKTGSAWMAIFASALFHLETARHLVEAGRSTHSLAPRSGGRSASARSGA